MWVSFNFLCSSFQKLTRPVQVYTVLDIHQGAHSNSSIGLGFLNPPLRLNSWDVTSFCMQLRNREDRLWTKVKGEGKKSSFSCTLACSKKEKKEKNEIRCVNFFPFYTLFIKIHRKIDSPLPGYEHRTSSVASCHANHWAMMTWSHKKHYYCLLWLTFSHH